MTDDRLAASIRATAASSAALDESVAQVLRRLDAVEGRRRTAQCGTWANLDGFAAIPGTLIIYATDTEALHG